MTFDFVMDAFPAKTKFGKKKVLVDMQVLEGKDVSELAFHQDVDPDDHGAEVAVSVIDKASVPAGFEANQDKVTISRVGNIITIKVKDGETLEKWTSTDPTQAALGDQSWIAVAIDTGVDDITTVTWNGAALTAADVADAEAVGLPAGSLVYWARAEQLEAGAKTIVLGYADGTEQIIAVRM